MDMMKMGAFLAELRKENGLTQAELGEKIGVTNKTVSRWETGTYMPPVEMLEILSDMYHLSINELLSGKRLNHEEYKEMAEQNIKTALAASAFELKEKLQFFKNKWRKDHMAGLILSFVLWAGVLIALKLQGVNSSLLGAVGGIMAILIYGIFNNQMMTYVEKNAYDGTGMSRESE